MQYIQSSLKKYISEEINLGCVRVYFDEYKNIKIYLGIAPENTNIIYDTLNQLETRLISKLFGGPDVLEDVKKIGEAVDSLRYIAAENIEKM